MNVAALIIGIVLLGIASASLFWNIYRDILLKPRTSTSSRISNVHFREEVHGPYVDITLVNKGPGEVIVESIFAKHTSLKKRLGREPRFAMIVQDYENPLNPRLPATVDVYHKMTQLLPYDSECFLKTGVSRYGFIDSLGQYHWVKRRDSKRIARQYREQFGNG